MEKWELDRDSYYRKLGYLEQSYERSKKQLTNGFIIGAIKEWMDKTQQGEELLESVRRMMDGQRPIPKHRTNNPNADKDEQVLFDAIDKYLVSLERDRQKRRKAMESKEE